MKFAMAIFLMAIANCCCAQHILINKAKLTLAVVNKSDTLFKAPVSVAINRGNKTRRGDRKTPEGTFTISEILNSSSWTHDFKDGKGEVKGAYGPWFFRLGSTPWTKIGIHGTCFPKSIGTRATEGCIRLRNNDLNALKPYVKVGMKVIITPDR